MSAGPTASKTIEHPISAAGASKGQQLLWPSLLLFAATLALYWPATRFNFVAFDDDQYVFDNPWVAQGLNASTAKWALTSTYAANWHPVTWISHLLDTSIYGTQPGGPHFTNILLHAINALLLFFLLRRLTGAAWPSWVAAALFAWHPLRVESVAWISERKDLLCGLFWILTIWAYVKYADELRVQNSSEFKVQSSKSKVFYILSLIFFVLGLLSKPMIVTLPCVLLLLDYWPLQRRSFKDKRLFFALLFAGCGIAFIAQHNWGAVKTLEESPLSIRIANAPQAYVAYLTETLWPANLCPLYPFPDKLVVWPAVGCALVLMVVTVLVLRCRRECPWVLVGWLWFLGTLVPVLGLVRVGGQSHADRFTYIPTIGLLIMLVGSVQYWLDRKPLIRPWLLGSAFACLVGCVFGTEHQLPYWRDSIAFYERILEVFPNSAGAHNGLGLALSFVGRRPEAVEQFKSVLKLQPDSVHAHYNLGIELAEEGKLDEAIIQFDQAVKLTPRSEQLHNNIGVVLAQQGKLEAALQQFQQAIQINPSYPKPYLNSAKALEKLGRTNEAAADYARAAQLDPDLRSSNSTPSTPLAPLPAPLPK